MPHRALSPPCVGRDDPARLVVASSTSFISAGTAKIHSLHCSSSPQQSLRLCRGPHIRRRQPPHVAARGRMISAPTRPHKLRITRHGINAMARSLRCSSSPQQSLRLCRGPHIRRCQPPFTRGPWRGRPHGAAPTAHIIRGLCRGRCPHRPALAHINPLPAARGGGHFILPVYAPGTISCSR